MILREYRLESAHGSLTIRARSEAEALQSACADMLGGAGPLFEPVVATLVPLRVVVAYEAFNGDRGAL